jgi:NADH-quinone oxidoreductase subunit J
VLVQILFYAFAAIMVLAGLGVIISRNPVYSALFLVLCFFTSAVLWLLIEAEFLAIVLVLVYVGAVMVLFLFVVMMLDIHVEELRRGFMRYAWLGWLVTGVVLFELVGVIVVRRLGVDVTQPAVPVPADYSSARELGTVLFTHYAYPIEIAAMLLLVAIIAAIALTMRRRPGLKVQNISMQVGARAKDRVKLLKMPPEKRT